MKNLSNIYIATNAVYNRTNEWKDKLKKAVPCLTSLEGSPFDRPIYTYIQPSNVNSIFKKGINPKAKAILEDILGKTAADEYHAEQTMLDDEENNEIKKKLETEGTQASQ